MRPLLFSLLLLAGCAVTGEAPPVGQAPINAVCPRSGKPVAEDSQTEYRGYLVGFCNPHCRDDFAAHREERPDDASFFDAAIAELFAGDEESE